MPWAASGPIEKASRHERMSPDLRYFEIDPRSRVFGLLRSDGELAQSLYLLKFRFENPEWFEEERSISDEYGGLIEAIDEMVIGEPRFAERWFEIPRHNDRFSGPLGVLAEGTDRAPLVDILFEGERELAPGKYVPARWIDDRRCREIALWLDTVTPSEIDAALLEHLTRRCDGDEAQARTLITQSLRRMHHDQVRRFRELFAGAADRKNTVVVLVQ